MQGRIVKAGFFFTLFFLIFSHCFSQDISFFEKKNFISHDGDTLLYRLYAPQTNKKIPLIVFFHGVGERGNDNMSQLINGVPLIYKNISALKQPCFIMAPQCPLQYKWANVKFDTIAQAQDSIPQKPLLMVVQAIDQLLKNYQIDSNRIYVMGLSMGGFAVWDIITRYPHEFAAAVPVCGGGDENKAALIAHLPVWAFHGAKDKVVKVERSRNMIAAMRRAGGKPVYTEYKDMGHGCWNKAFSEEAMYKWLFLQKKSN